jgi:SAM-dependent methyltransferase
MPPETLTPHGSKRSGGVLPWLRAGLSWRVQGWLSTARNARTTLGTAFHQAIGTRRSEEQLIADSKIYWTREVDKSLGQNSHWRGVGIFEDDSRWWQLGQGHLRLYEEFARALRVSNHCSRVVEWGCGGGLNAVHFGPLAAEFCGVDISSASLAECAKQMSSAGLTNFKPILIDPANPEAAVKLIPGPCDLFLSTYVFELLPTPEYGLRILKIAYDLLAADGLALIQIKYDEGNWTTRAKRWAYVKNLAWNATYRIEEFWKAAQESGMTPRMVVLRHYEPLVNDRNYAYYLLQKEPVEKASPQLR